MRRPRSVGEAQGWRTVDRLARKFEYPDERTFPTAPAFGGAFAFDVAAVDAPEWQKDAARYVCDGVDDHEEIMAAVNDPGGALNRFKSVQLSSGQFLVDLGGINLLDVHLRGTGMNATLFRNQQQGTPGGDPSFTGQYLIFVGQDAELSSVGFRTTSSFQGTCVLQNYGFIHDVAHQDGQADRLLYARGTLFPIAYLWTWTEYLDAMIHLAEGWYTINGVFATTNGKAFFIDRFGTAAISNVVVMESSIGPATDHAIEIDNAGYVALSNVAISRQNSDHAAIYVNSQPLAVVLSNVVVRRAGYGILIADGGGLDKMDITNFTCEVTISGLDFEGSAGIIRNLTISGFRATGIAATGSGIRARVIASANDDLAISNFDIREFLQGSGIEIHRTGTSPSVRYWLAMNDGRISRVGKHGIFVDAAGPSIHDVKIAAAGLETADTYDGIHVTGNGLAGTTKIHHNDFKDVTSLRYGINIAHADVVDAIVVGNNLGDPTAYATDALNDDGTDTQLTYPDDATYGDNFIE